MKIKSIIDLGPFGRHEIILSPGAEETIRVGQEVTGRIMLVAVDEYDTETEKLPAKIIIPDANQDLLDVYKRAMNRFPQAARVEISSFNERDRREGEIYLPVGNDITRKLYDIAYPGVTVSLGEAYFRKELIADRTVWFAVRSQTGKAPEPITFTQDQLINLHNELQINRGLVKIDRLALIKAGQDLVGQPYKVVPAAIIEALEESIKGHTPYLDQDVVSVTGGRGAHLYTCMIREPDLSARYQFQKEVAITGEENPPAVWYAIF